MWAPLFDTFTVYQEPEFTARLSGAMVDAINQPGVRSCQYWLYNSPAVYLRDGYAALSAQKS